MECTEFELLLSEAIDEDGQLSGTLKDSFEAHSRICQVCGPLFAEVRAGKRWLSALEPVEPPAQLVHNILAATTGISSTRVLAATPETRTTPLAERVREWWDSFFTPVAAFARQPRFVMSFGMIFFSFSLALSAAGVKPADVAKINLRPAALRHAYNDAQIKVVKYYDNIRFVYEIESRVREFKRATTPAEPGPKEQKENRKNDTSGQPDQRQDRNYSREENQPVLAGLLAPSFELRASSYELKPASCGLHAANYESKAISEHSLARSSKLVARSYQPPAVTVTTNRRLV
jgi:hypothetical protein